VTHWFVIRDLSSYEKNSDKIFFNTKCSRVRRFKSFFKKEAKSKFFDIKKNDVVDGMGSVKRLGAHAIP
jgi:hypothetical protein